ncbi:MAG: ArsA family ATPase [Chromatiaceae bacterium]|nr:ArsA family ATPase [Chromatiaceae bacterium]
MTVTTQPEFLHDPALALLYFGGKGGVGKTSCACAAALQIAEQRPTESMLLLSTDPAHSLNDALAGMSLPANLEALELDAVASLARFKQQHRAKLEEISSRGTLFDEEDIHALMEMALPGMDELAAYLEMADWIEQQRYDCIIVDTAPTGHTLRLLEMPELISRWIRALDALLAKHRYLRRRFKQDQSQDHLDCFLLALDGSRRAMAALIEDGRRCRFIPVMLAESMSVEETADLLRLLDAQGIGTQELVVNRLLPETDCALCRLERRRQLRALAAFDQLGREVRLWALPLLADEPRGQALTGLWSQVQLLAQGERTDAARAAEALATETELPTQVVAPTPLPPASLRLLMPPASLRLLMLAGKGGVGKTTLASATALRLLAEQPEGRILLFSTDPAHSLADCLGQALGPEPVSVCAGLDAQELSAEQAFSALRQRYRDELRGFLADTLNNLDITFDREAMEHLLDLAPPGLDELMALTRVMDHLDGGHYDLVVLDTAPSGHTLRLLELPGLIHDWLKLFFQLLLKYRRVLRVPALSQDLVELAKAVKRLRALLADPQQAACYLVTVPTALGLAETEDLIMGFERLQIQVAALFVNQLTPAAGDCSLCAALQAREARELAHARRRFPDLQQTLVYRQTEPVGLEALKRLGDALYSPKRGPV